MSLDDCSDRFIKKGSLFAEAWGREIYLHTHKTQPRAFLFYLEFPLLILIFDLLRGDMI